jgi:hypothetical protein
MLLVGLLSLVLVSFIDGVRELFTRLGVSESTQAYLLHGDGWRLLMIAGALPAVMVFFIRLFVPESRKWEAERDRGGTNHWATRDLLGVLVGCTAAALVIFLWSPAFAAMFPAASGPGATSNLPLILRIGGTAVGLAIALVGYIFPVARYLRRAESAGDLPRSDRFKYLGRMLLGAALAGVALLGTWGSLQWAPKWAIALANQLPAEGGPYHAKEYTQIALAMGASVGTLIAAWVAGLIGRRITYVLLCIASFVSLIYMYRANTSFDTAMLISVFIAGGTTAAFYGWFPLYLPELFPTSIRATCQGFAYNFGRVLSALGSLQTATLTAYFAQGIAPDRVEIDAFPQAGATLAAIYIVGVFLIWLGPETKGQPLPA